MTNVAFVPTVFMEDGGGKQAKVAIFLIARLPASKQTFVFEIRNSL